MKYFPSIRRPLIISQFSDGIQTTGIGFFAINSRHAISARFFMTNDSRKPMLKPIVNTRVNYTDKQRQSYCKKCREPLKSPFGIIEGANRFLQCTNCRTLYSSNTFHGAGTQRYTVSKQPEAQLRSPPYPSEIARYLDKYVIGQDESKKVLAVGVYQHYRRISCNVERSRAIGQSMTFSMGGGTSNTMYSHLPSHMESQNVIHTSLSKPPIQITPVRSDHFYRGSVDEDEDVKLEKSNIVLLGPSGVGKTFITQVLSRILDVPIAFCDCTSMTQAGYVGEDVESVLQKLLQNAQGNIDRAQQGIVFLDEIDKIASTGESHADSRWRDVGGEGVQHALLKMVEGTVASVKTGRKGPGQQDQVSMDTTDILFVGSGAFTGLEKIVGRRLDKKSVGFGTKNATMSITNDDEDNQIINQKRDSLFMQADQGDLIKYGIVPELVGRFPVIVPFHSFDKNMLVRVLTEPKNSLLAQQKAQFAMDGVVLEFSEDALEEIAQIALKRKTGARALRSIMENVLKQPKFEVPGSDIESVRITDDYVKSVFSIENRLKYEFKQRTRDMAARRV